MAILTGVRISLMLSIQRSVNVKLRVYTYQHKYVHFLNYKISVHMPSSTYLRDTCSRAYGNGLFVILYSLCAFVGIYKLIRINV
jgi:hypothetical protein